VGSGFLRYSVVLRLSDYKIIHKYKISETKCVENAISIHTVKF